MNYIHESGNSAYLDGGLIFLSGSPALSDKAGIKQDACRELLTMIPAIIRSNQKPSYAVNCIEDWEEKLNELWTRRFMWICE
jgi:hypothetical protein